MSAGPRSPFRLALVLIATSACRRVESQNADKLAGSAMTAVTSFHAQLAQGRYADLCKNAERYAFSGSTGLACSEFLAYLHDKLGDAIETMRTDRPHVEDRPAGASVRVEVHYATRYERGLALEYFGWRIGGTQPILISYRIDANALK